MSPIAATEALAEFTRTADVASGPPKLREYAVRAIIDTVGVAMAARNEPAVELLARTVDASATAGDAMVWATGERTSPEQAALLNGTAAHALDYDDVAEAIHTHPGAVMVPALLGMAEVIGASGRDVVDAYVIGYEVQTAVAEGMDLTRHYKRGWHGSSSIAGLGGAAGVARLLRLDTLQIRNALGIAASMAGGSRQNFGTMTKPLHTGLTARDSVLAARLAAAGLTADPGQLEGPLGYFTMFGDGPAEQQRVVDRIQRPWSLLETPLNIKPYPCCYRASRTAYAAIQLSGVAGLDTSEIDTAVITMEPFGTAPLIHSRPTRGLEGKFSAEYVLATGLLDGRVELTSFTDAAVGRPEAQAVIHKVSVCEAEVPPFGPKEWAGGYATVSLTMTTGEVHRVRVDVPHGHDDDPLTEDELHQKFTECLSYGAAGWDAEQLYRQLRDINTEETFTGLVGVGADRKLSSAGR